MTIVATMCASVDESVVVRLLAAHVHETPLRAPQQLRYVLSVRFRGPWSRPVGSMTDLWLGQCCTLIFTVVCGTLENGLPRELQICLEPSNDASDRHHTLQHKLNHY